MNFLPEYVYIFFIALLVSFSLILAIKLYKFSMLILDIEDAIEECLDILNTRYGSMNKIIQKPIFFDSIEIRQVISDLKDSHNAVLIVANKLTSQEGFKSETKKEVQKSTE